jgi:hypothetical protein
MKMDDKFFNTKSIEKKIMKGIDENGEIVSLKIDIDKQSRMFSDREMDEFRILSKKYE